MSVNQEGIQLVEKYHLDTTPVIEKDRNRIINFALGHVIREIGNYCPQTSTKERLAAAIVVAFPQMGLVREGIAPHAYIFLSV